MPAGLGARFLVRAHVPLVPVVRQADVEIPPLSPVPVCDVLAADRREHHRGPPVGEAADRVGAPLDLAVEPLEPVVGADPPPVLHGEAGVGERLGHVLADHPGRVGELRRLQLAGHLLGLAQARAERLLGVYGLELRGDPPAPAGRHLGQHVAVEVDRAALVHRLGEDLGERPEHAGGLVARDQPHAAQAPLAQRQQELPPAVGALRVALGAPYDLAVPVGVDADRDQHRHALVGASPVLLEVGAVDVDVGARAGERPRPPRLDGGERLLVEVRDGALGHRRAPQNLAHVLDAPGRDAGQVHLHHGLLDAGLAPPVPLDDLRGEGRAAQLGDVQLHLAGADDQPPLVVAAAIRLPLVGALVAPCVHQLVGLLVEQRVDGLLDGAQHQLPDVSLYGLVVE